MYLIIEKSLLLQKDENQLSRLLDELDQVLRQSLLPWYATSLEAISQIAARINCIRLGRGDMEERMTHAFQQAFIQMDEDYTDASWGKGSTCRYTPASITRMAQKILEHPTESSDVSIW